MSKAGLGAALQSLGANIPRITSSVLGELEKGRKAEIEAKEREELQKDRELNRDAKRQSLKLGGYQLDEAEAKKKLKDEAVSKYEQFQKDMENPTLRNDTLKEISSQIDNMSPEQALEAANKLYKGDLGEDKTRKEMFQERGLGRYKELDPRIKAEAEKYQSEDEAIAAAKALEEERKYKEGVSEKEQKDKIELEDIKQEGRVELEKMRSKNRREIANINKKTAQLNFDSTQGRLVKKDGNQQYLNVAKNTMDNHKIARNLGKLNSLLGEDAGGIWAEDPSKLSMGVIGLGKKPFKKFMMDDLSSDMRVLLADIANVEIKDQTGAQVNESEMERIMTALGMDTTVTAKSFLGAMQRVSRNVYDKVRTWEGSINNPVAFQQWDSNKGWVNDMGLVPTKEIKEYDWSNLHSFSVDDYNPNKKGSAVVESESGPAAGKLTPEEAAKIDSEVQAILDARRKRLEKEGN